MSIVKNIIEKNYANTKELFNQYKDDLRFSRFHEYQKSLFRYWRRNKIKIIVQKNDEEELFFICRKKFKSFFNSVSIDEQYSVYKNNKCIKVIDSTEGLPLILKGTVVKRLGLKITRNLENSFKIYKK